MYISIYIKLYLIESFLYCSYNTIKMVHFFFFFASAWLSRSQVGGCVTEKQTNQIINEEAEMEPEMFCSRDVERIVKEQGSLSGPSSNK